MVSADTSLPATAQTCADEASRHYLDEGRQYPACPFCHSDEMQARLLAYRTAHADALDEIAGAAEYVIAAWRSGDLSDVELERLDAGVDRRLRLRSDYLRGVTYPV